MRALIAAIWAAFLVDGAWAGWTLPRRLPDFHVPTAFAVITLLMPAFGAVRIAGMEAASEAWFGPAFLVSGAAGLALFHVVL